MTSSSSAKAGESTKSDKDAPLSDRQVTSLLVCLTKLASIGEIATSLTSSTPDLPEIELSPFATHVVEELSVILRSLKECILELSSLAKLTDSPENSLSKIPTSSSHWVTLPSGQSSVKLELENPAKPPFFQHRPRRDSKSFLRITLLRCLDNGSYDQPQLLT